jgi:DNA-binding CsgD family transcriptional regulator
VARGALALVAPLVAVAAGDASLVPSQMDDDFAEHRQAARTPDDAAVLAAAAAWAIERGDPAGARRDLRLAIGCLSRATPLAAAALAYGATYLEPAELGPLRALIAQPFHPSDGPGRAYAMLATAILERRFGDPTVSRERAAEAAAGFRACGRPLLEAWALEVAGEPDAARALYTRCGARAQARRLGAPAPDVANASGAALSKREEDVARKVARGASNAQIGDDLSISVRTVEKHIASIFTKLGLRKRSQIAAAFARED